MLMFSVWVRLKLGEGEFKLREKMYIYLFVSCSSAPSYVDDGSWRSFEVLLATPRRL